MPLMGYGSPLIDTPLFLLRVSDETVLPRHSPPHLHKGGKRFAMMLL